MLEIEPNAVHAWRDILKIALDMCSEARSLLITRRHRIVRCAVASNFRQSTIHNPHVLEAENVVTHDKLTNISLCRPSIAPATRQSGVERKPHAVLLQLWMQGHTRVRFMLESL